jgi:antitoxin HicB
MPDRRGVLSATAAGGWVQLRSSAGPRLAAMAALEFDVVLVQERDGTYSVTVPALPGCASQGETRSKAIAMIREAIELYIESLVARGDHVPGSAEAGPRVEVERVTVAT